ncbi:MAG: hypothetical protein J3Q66DRAFT_439562 [Benniella sp.]|nr:MAG: hypothetical protein J3Q66DRAFT_439562 [Benniella sp.]
MKKKPSFKGVSSNLRKAEEEAQDEDTSSKDGKSPIFHHRESSRETLLNISIQRARQYTSLFFDTAEPTAVPQVFTVIMIPDSDHPSLKTHDGRYLSSGKFEIVSADSEAIGMRDERTVVVRTDEQGGICLQSHYGKFLSVDEVAAGDGKKRSSSPSAIPAPSTKLQVQSLVPT